jgi:succinyldiaminopimelate transaminase
MKKAFTPPPYPYERLGEIRALADQHEGGVIDCSVGTPCDPPPAPFVADLAASNQERGYPTSAGSEGVRGAAAGWMERRFGVHVDPNHLALCIGTKEFVASSAQYLALANPERTVVLFPEVAYPTYAMGALLAGLEPVAVPMEGGHLDLEAVPRDVAERALVLWSNSPSNPTGMLDDLGAAAAWGRRHGVPVFSDECYCEFTWDGSPQTILSHGLEGVVAVHSLSKRSNLAGVRVGFYAGDPEIVAFLRSVRQHAGMMVAGPVQYAAIGAYDDDAHVEHQRSLYRERLELLAGALEELGVDAQLPQGTFYLWVRVPETCVDGWVFARQLAEASGMLVSPGDFYGEASTKYVRIAVVQPTERLELVAERLRQAR